MNADLLIAIIQWCKPLATNITLFSAIFYMVYHFKKPQKNITKFAFKFSKYCVIITLSWFFLRSMVFSSAAISYKFGGTEWEPILMAFFH